MTPNPTPNKDSAELRELLHKFGREYEWPYRFMPDKHRSPADQQTEAREALLNELLPKLEAHTASQVAAEKRGIEKAVVEIASAKTEGLFDHGDLFIKREPIDQAVINLVGYEKFKAIRESLPEAHLTTEQKDKL